MKNQILILSVYIICALSLAGCRVVTFDNLPSEAQVFLTENFPEFPVSYAVKECNEYEITLSNGAEIEFNGKGEWKSVDMHHGMVPDGVLSTLPAPIITYLSSSFAQVPVEKVKKGFRYAYELELVNDLELKFNSKGVCRKIDD